MPYSNVTPPALPAYDTTAYPNYVLVFNYSKGGTDWNQVHLMYCTTPFTYNGYVTNADATHGWRVAGKDGEWSAEVFEETKLTLKPGLNGEVYQRIYTNHDILDSSGKVWLAADSVTPVEDNRDLRTYSLGITLALIQKALSPIRKQPTAYLYNGVKLPALPECELPYAAMSFSEFAGGYRNGTLLYSSNPIKYYNEYQQIFDTTKAMVSDGETVCYRYYEGYPNNPDGWSEVSDINVVPLSDTAAPVFWANHDVYVVEDGSLLVAASDPIPVYE